MSCPDWRLLTARREREGADPEGWAEAMEHFDSCPPCRRAALAADPLLVFRRLPKRELGAAEERSEVEAVRQAVTAMRTARRLAARRSFGWRRWSAAAVLALAALSVSREKDPRLEMARTVRASLLVPMSQPAPGRSALEPSVDVLNHPDARVYQMNDEGLAVIMVVHESFDV